MFPFAKFLNNFLIVAKFRIFNHSSIYKKKQYNMYIKYLYYGVNQALSYILISSIPFLLPLLLNFFPYSRSYHFSHLIRVDAAILYLFAIIFLQLVEFSSTLILFISLMMLSFYSSVYRLILVIVFFFLTWGFFLSLL